jgi:ferric-dicitrate binding protein FerR (iron transport regulator)
MMQENKNMDQLLTAYLLGELDESNTHFVSEWIAASEKNQKYFEDFAEIWNFSKTQSIPEFEPNNAWKKISPKIQKTPFYKKQWLQIAATVLILIGTITTITQITSNHQSTVIYSETEILQDTLNDGSIISLNQESKISYTEHFGAKTREVLLEGEAFFDIERDTTKPFIIHLDQSEVRVLGTSFNIKSNPEDELISVFVKSGVVMFKYLSDETDSTYLSIKLKAGDKVVYNKKTYQLEPVNKTSEKSTDMYWLNQELIFDGIELKKVSEILETVYDVKISFTDDQTKKCLLTVNFQNANINHIMEVIATTFELDLKYSNNHYTLKGISCAEN